MKRLQTVLACLFIASTASYANAHEHKAKAHSSTHKEMKQHNNAHNGEHKGHPKAQHATESNTHTIGNLLIKKAMIRETPPGTSVAAGYLSITNTGTEDDTLIGITTQLTDTVQVHEMKMENNVMKMSEIPSNLVIPKGQTIILEPGGLHLMFMNLSEQLTSGNSEKVTLVFEKAGHTDIIFPIKKAGAKKHHH